MEEGGQKGRSTQLFVAPPTPSTSTTPMKRKSGSTVQEPGEPSTSRQRLRSPGSAAKPTPYDAVEVEDEECDEVVGWAASIAGPSTLPTIQLVEGPPSSTDHARRKGPPHICEVCDKHFSRPSMLSTHMNIHTGATPYLCKYPDCPARFNARSNAMRHRFRHGTAFANWQAEADAGEREGEVWVGGEGAEPSKPPRKRPKKMIFVAAEVGPAPPHSSPASATGKGRARRGRHAGSEVRWLPVNQVSRGKDRG
ncbi:hypothetical protein EV715DRAFT_292630 [Schizophyllum commune]